MEFEVSWVNYPPDSNKWAPYRNLRQCGPVTLHYSVHFFSNFSLSCNDRNRGVGYRCTICTVPTPFFESARPPLENGECELRAMSMAVAGSSTQSYKILCGWAGGPAVSIHMALSSIPPFARASRADTRTVRELYRFCTDTHPLDYDRCVKEKIVKKSGWSSVVLRTLPVLQFLGSGSSVL